jgi:hypothetical protein
VSASEPRETAPNQFVGAREAADSFLDQIYGSSKINLVRDPSSEMM